jgi:hypothetical protein
LETEAWALLALGLLVLLSAAQLLTMWGRDG